MMSKILGIINKRDMLNMKGKTGLGIGERYETGSQLKNSKCMKNN